MHLAHHSQLPRLLYRDPGAIQGHSCCTGTLVLKSDSCAIQGHPCHTGILVLHGDICVTKGFLCHAEIFVLQRYSCAIQGCLCYKGSLVPYRDICPQHPHSAESPSMGCAHPQSHCTSKSIISGKNWVLSRNDQKRTASTHKHLLSYRSRWSDQPSCTVSIALSAALPPSHLPEHLKNTFSVGLRLETRCRHLPRYVGSLSPCQHPPCTSHRLLSGLICSTLRRAFTVNHSG